MRISDWSSDVCSSDLEEELEPIEQFAGRGLLLEPGDVADLVEGVERLADEQLLDAGEMDVDDRLHRLAARKSDVMEEAAAQRSEEHTSELQSLMRTSYAVFCLKKKKQYHNLIYN